MNSSISERARLVVVSVVFLMLGLSGCAGYQTPDQRMKAGINLAKVNYDNCTSAYKSDPKLKAFSDLLLTESISTAMTRDDTKPTSDERQQIRALANKEIQCRKRLIYGAAKAIDGHYAVRSSPVVVSMIKSLAENFIQDTEANFKYLYNGDSTYGDFYADMRELIRERDRSMALHSALGHVEANINYQQRRTAVNQAMANVQKGMQENCIGCALSKENRKKTGSNIVTQRSNGVLQGQEVSGTNKICRYNRNGSTNYVTVKAHELCPLSGTDGDVADDSFNSNGVFKSSYDNGLNKVCVYDQYGSKNVITVGLTERCPD